MKVRDLGISPTKDATPHPTEEEEMITILDGADYLWDWRHSKEDPKTPNVPGPLLSKNMKDDLVQFIQRRTHECLIKDAGPDQQAGFGLIPENPIKYFNTADLLFEDWDVESETILDSEALIPEHSIKYFNTADLLFEDWDVDNEVQDMPSFHPSCLKFLTDPHAVFVAQYTLGNLLGRGSFGSVYEGIRKKDGQQVAVKYISKDASDNYITLPGESCKLPLEVALMQAVSKPPQCKTVLQLLDWFDMPDYVLLVLERPIPCMDVRDLHKFLGGIISESLSKFIIQQELRISGLQNGFSRESIMPNLSTVWNIGVLIFNLVCGKMPFRNPFVILPGNLSFRPGLSKDCCHLIKWCLEEDQTKRPSLIQISEHKWFIEDLEDLGLDYDDLR